MVDLLPTEQHGFHVSFEERPEEDRAATVKSGHPVFVDVEYAILTMPGGSLVVDKKVSDELLKQWEFGDNKRKPPLPFAIASYRAWKDGKEAPVNGIDLKNWPGVTPAQLKTCQGINVKTVENLASADADTIRKLSMGGVALVTKAKAYLAAANGNVSAEKITDLELKLEEMAATIAKKDTQIDELMEQLTEPKKAKKKA